MSVREQTEQQALHEPFLADDDSSDLTVEGFDPARRLRDSLLELANLARHDRAHGGGYSVGILEGLHA
jgi:hypothetical protein